MEVNFGIIFFLTFPGEIKKTIIYFHLEINFWLRFASSIEILKDIVFLKSQVLFQVKGEEKLQLFFFFGTPGK